VVADVQNDAGDDGFFGIRFRISFWWIAAGINSV
jgi:hypothetical protein